ncbi:MAG: hypothetical protein ACN0LA_09560 [Candidatus Longimicrobiales bacterium M2_2A_002]
MADVVPLRAWVFGKYADVLYTVRITNRTDDPIASLAMVVEIYDTTSPFRAVGQRIARDNLAPHEAITDTALAAETNEYRHKAFHAWATGQLGSRKVRAQVHSYLDAAMGTWIEPPERWDDIEWP